MTGEVSESRLRAQLAQRPDSAAAWSALGAMHASQARWGDAQQAWFEAYRLDPDDPDHAYNLAVSLDHLGKLELARQFYEKALAAVGQRPANFAAARVRARLAELPR